MEINKPKVDKVEVFRKQLIEQLKHRRINLKGRRDDEDNPIEATEEFWDGLHAGINECISIVENMAMLDLRLPTGATRTVFGSAIPQVAEEEAKVTFTGSPIPNGKSFEDVYSEKTEVVIRRKMQKANEILESYMPTPEQQAKDFEDMAIAHKALMNNEPISGKLEAIKLVKIIKPKTYTIKNKDNEVGLICSRIIGCVNENKEVLPDLFAQPTEILCTGTDIEVSDGYHTMTELYEHRNRLFIALCRALTRLYIRRQVEPSFVNECKEVWRSKTEDPEWFLLGIETVPEHQITYHLHISLWSDTEFAYTRETPPEFDGHTSNDVLERLKALI